MTIDVKELIQELDKKVDEGLVSMQTHPLYPNLAIYNYTQECQFSRCWNEYTMVARGLIVDKEKGEIVARPFLKFFNYGEHIQLGFEMPDEMPLILEKLDGSLGILYWVDDTPWIATRGSFDSNQARWATQWFRDNIDYSTINKDLTYLFEIIYKENRIVVNYDFEGLVFLSAIHIQTGRTELGVPIPKTINGTEMRTCRKFENMSIKDALTMNLLNEEGFVIFFPQSGIRTKIKFNEYVRLHKIMTGLSVKGIWEFFVEKGIQTDVKTMVENVPDEFYDWLNQVATEMKDSYRIIQNTALQEFDEVETMKLNGATRAEMAEYIKKQTYPQLLFALLDSKDIAPMIFKMIKPKGGVTFKLDIDA